MDQRAKFRRKAQQHGDDGSSNKHQRRVDFGHGHHTDIFSIGGHAATADRAGKHRCQNHRLRMPAHIRVHIASGHPGDCLEMT
ncbi:Uncharacterised protein [Escherichia coli]|uniref:Uncharacterized protein n=1 Tax=Escherichia coli TaxID=562 RepID=A0A376P3R2_ECOLX|nr:Uncharacterised protein [Escherichia coli]